LRCFELTDEKYFFDQCDPKEKRSIDVDDFDFFFFDFELSSFFGNLFNGDELLLSSVSNGFDL
tara:strand:+ start:1016 stop:1204 length:189 start_codon:yes stop_codon:yes gene_type:complete